VKTEGNVVRTYLIAFHRAGENPIALIPVTRFRLFINKSFLLVIYPFRLESVGYIIFASAPSILSRIVSLSELNIRSKIVKHERSFRSSKTPYYCLSFTVILHPIFSRYKSSYCFLECLITTPFSQDCNINPVFNQKENSSYQ